MLEIFEAPITNKAKLKKYNENKYACKIAVAGRFEKKKETFYSICYDIYL